MSWDVVRSSPSPAAATAKPCAAILGPPVKALTAERAPSMEVTQALISLRTAELNAAGAVPWAEELDDATDPVDAAIGAAAAIPAKRRTVFVKCIAELLENLTNDWQALGG